ncbi:MAG: hypothetical protein IJS15_17255 [Victivallales bacterium]|nr:hypothetical protein [Victivallales bacterium]
MADYFYFLSSLPMLRWGEKPPVSHERFLALCQELLGDELSSAIGSLQLLPDEARKSMSPVASAWHEFETFLRNTTGNIRRNRMRKSGAVMTIHETDYISAIEAKRIEEILAIASPLERENALDSLRWKFLDGLEAKHTYSKGAVEIYALRLLLLEKQASRQYETGKAAFDRLMEDGLEKAIKARTTEEVQ